MSDVLQVYFTPDEFTPVAPAGAQNAPGEIGDCEAVGHFFLYPAGHLGFVPESFLINLPLAQVIVIFFAVAAAGLAAATSLTFLTSGAGLSYLTSAVPVLCVAAEEV